MSSSPEANQTPNAPPANSPPDNQVDRSFILVIALALVGAVIMGAIIIANLVTPASNAPGSTAQAETAATAEMTRETQAAPEETAESAAEATAEANSEGPAESSGEAATEDTAEANQTAGNSDATSAGASSGDSNGTGGSGGAATPTSLSRVTASILIGTEATMSPRSSGEGAPPNANGNTGDGPPTPTSISRVTQSIILGAASQGTPEAGQNTAPSEATAEATTPAEPAATAEATNEATSEATEEEAATSGAAALSSQDEPTGTGGGSSRNEVGSAAALPTPVEGLPRSSPSALDAQGEVAAQTQTQWWVMVALGTAVYAYVMILLLVVLRRRAPNITEEQDSPARQRNFIAFNGIAMPFVILTIILSITVGTLAAFTGRDTELNVEVIGHRWWWEIKYPDHDIVTANEIHMPVGARVRFTLRSVDVIHSFWVPQLGGKMDLIPGRTNSLWLQAKTAGTYRGICAEFCGDQHTHMQFLVIADSPADFQAWLDQQRQPAVQPVDDVTRAGQQVFLTQQCAICHTIRGTDAQGVQGPDLTHLASRHTLAAGTLPNTTGHLAGWIVDSQQIKPGNLMPPMDVTGQDLQALLAYLNSLD